METPTAPSRKCSEVVTPLGTCRTFCSRSCAPTPSDVDSESQLDVASGETAAAPPILGCAFAQKDHDVVRWDPESGKIVDHGR